MKRIPREWNCSFLLLGMLAVAMLPAAMDGPMNDWRGSPPDARAPFTAPPANSDLDASTLLRTGSANYFLGISEAFHSNGINGTGITVAVVDTGINPDHEVFAGKNITWSDVTVDNFSHPIDIDGHGTMCSSILAGSSDNYTGIAPGADLVAVKLFYKDEGKLTADVPEATAAVDYLLDHAEALEIKVASLSWGDDNESNGQDQLSREVARLVDAGIVTVVAAGNYKEGLQRVAAPATAAEVITVGALDTGTGKAATFSLPGPTADGRVKPDLLAPGTAMHGARHDGNDTYRTGQGSSYSTPVVAGVAALLLERYPDLDPVKIKQLLCVTALESDFTHGFKSFQEGWGIVNPPGAVMAMEHSWEWENGPANVHINTTDPAARSYFTRVAFARGDEVKISISFPGAEPSTQAFLHQRFQAYLYEMRDNEDEPTLISRSFGGNMVIQVARSGEYLLGFKPLPWAWLSSGVGIEFEMKMEIARTQVISLAAIIASFNLGASAALVMTMLAFTRQMKKDSEVRGSSRSLHGDSPEK